MLTRLAILAAILVSTPALAANQVITINDDEQKQLPAAWDACVKQGGLTCISLYNFYMLQKPQPEAPAAPAATQPPAKPAPPAK